MYLGCRPEHRIRRRSASILVGEGSWQWQRPRLDIWLGERWVSRPRQLGRSSGRPYTACDGLGVCLLVVAVGGEERRERGGSKSGSPGVRRSQFIV